MTTIGENIKNLRNEKKLTQEDLAKATGLKRSAIGMYESGKRNPDYETLEIFADYFNVNMDFLLGRKNYVQQSNAIPHPSLTPAKYKKFKVLGDIACGQPIEAIQQVEEFIETELNVHADYVLHCKGDSMINARIFNGDYVFIKEQPEVENGEIAAVEMDGTVTLKRFYRYDEYIELRAENPTYKPIIIHQTDFDSIRVLGKAVACQCFVE